MATLRYVLQRTLDILDTNPVGGLPYWESISNRVQVDENDNLLNLTKTENLSSLITGNLTTDTDSALMRVKYEVYDSDTSSYEVYSNDTFQYFYVNANQWEGTHDDDDWATRMSNGDASAVTIIIKLDPSQVNGELFCDTASNPGSIFTDAHSVVGDMFDNVLLRIDSILLNSSSSVTIPIDNDGMTTSAGVAVSSLIGGDMPILFRRNGYGSNQTSCRISGTTNTTSLRWVIPELDWSKSTAYSATATDDDVDISYNLYVSQVGGSGNFNLGASNYTISATYVDAASSSLVITDVDKKIYTSTSVSITVNVND